MKGNHHRIHHPSSEDTFGSCKHPDSLEYRSLNAAII